MKISLPCIFLAMSVSIFGKLVGKYVLVELNETVGKKISNKIIDVTKKVIIITYDPF